MSERMPRNEVISIRLNDERRRLLERYRDTFAAQLARPVSLAEAVFLGFENRAPELERVADLHECRRSPTIGLHRIRTRWETERALSAGEWALLAEYVHVGTDHEQQPPPFHPVMPSSASYRAVLDAFEAVFHHRPNPASHHIWTYFECLRGNETSIQLSSAIDNVEQRDGALTSLIAYRRQHSIESVERPRHLGQCFLTAVRHEGVDSTMLDRCLAPYWPVLWRLAARGHWLRHNYQPIRLPERASCPRQNWPILPSALSAGDLILSFSPAADDQELPFSSADDGSELPFSRADGPEFTTTVKFARSGVGLKLREYPRFAEFRAMLEGPEDCPWQGRFFFATRSASAIRSLSLLDDRGVLYFRFDLSTDDWRNLRDLTRQAWEDSALRWRLRALEDDYGEHAFLKLEAASRAADGAGHHESEHGGSGGDGNSSSDSRRVRHVWFT